MMTTGWGGGTGRSGRAGVECRCGRLIRLRLLDGDWVWIHVDGGSAVCADGRLAAPGAGRGLFTHLVSRWSQEAPARGSEGDGCRMREAAGSGEPGWRGEFREAVLRYVVREGIPIDVAGSHYNRYHHEDWLGIGAHLNIPAYIRQAGGATEHQRRMISGWSAGTPEGGCPLDLARMSWTESVWSEWGGTFAEDERVSGIDAVVWCECGRVGGIAWRWGGGYGELLRAITMVPG